MNTEEMFVRISDALSQVDDVADKTRTTMQLFGGGGAKLATAISGGSEELERMRAEARELGFALDPEALKLAEEATDNYSRATMHLQAVKNELGVAVMPAVNQALMDFSSLLSENSGKIKGFAQDVGGGLTTAIDFVRTHTEELGLACKALVGFVTAGASFMPTLADSVVSAIDAAGEAISSALTSARAAVSDWWTGVSDEASAWIRSIIDDIASTVTGGLASLASGLQDIPLVGRLFGGDSGSAIAAAQGGVTVNVQTSVDARGASPGAGADVGRALAAVGGVGGVPATAIAGALKRLRETDYD
jgi:phage-related protein